MKTVDPRLLLLVFLVVAALTGLALIALFWWSAICCWPGSPLLR